MTNRSRVSLVWMVSLFLLVPAWAQDLSKEDWQKQMTELTTRRNDLKNKLAALQTEVSNLKKQDGEKLAALKQCQDELAALVGKEDAPFVASLDKIDAKLNELSRLSNQDLWARRNEVDEAQNWLNDAKKNALSVLPKYSGRISDQQSRIDALKRTLQQISDSGMGMQTYTVGTWARDRDCLWNIAKKPKVYDNAFLWPKIWQGNRDMVKNPDVIQTGWKLKIPAKSDLTREERSALRSYWSKKQGSKPAGSK
ncbi:MAG: LysM domain-containing protein [Bacteroidetes bacterium]|nr:LysM domain-containing protein [Bacteroidota bacterium]